MTLARDDNTKTKKSHLRTKAFANEIGKLTIDLLITPQVATKTNIDKDFLGLLEATPVPMVLSRPDGSFEFVNNALCKMLGYSSLSYLRRFTVRI